MKTNEIASVAVAVLLLAGFSVAVANGGETAKVFQGAGGGFSQVVKAATLRG